MKVLLLGAGGMLAHDVRDLAPNAAELLPRTRADLDVTDEEAVAATIASVAPDVIVNCASYTNVDAAETNREVTWTVNARAPAIIGRCARPVGARVVHFSTDYIFSGTRERPYREEDPPDPANAYGASKLAGERALAETGTGYVVIRTSWLFGAHGRSFPGTMWRRARSRQPTRVVNDQTGRPTYTVDLARAVWGLLAEDDAAQATACTTRHIANAGQATWFDVARHIFESAGVPELVTPCTTAEFPVVAARPRYSVLDTSRHDASAGPLPRWEDALDRVLSEFRGAEQPG